MKITSQHSAEEKAKWEVVSLYNGASVPGEIISADEETGEVSMKVKAHDGTAADRTYSFGAYGIKLVARSRYRT
jgi:hypothetical protein